LNWHKNKIFFSNAWSGGPSFLSLPGYSYRPANLLSFGPKAKGVVKIAEPTVGARDFLKNFWGTPKQS
jgi:hypothetical protein